VGLLQTLCEVTKSGPPELIREHLSLALDVARSVGRIEHLVNNTLIRKLKTKIMARAALRLLPAKSNLRRRKGGEFFPCLTKYAYNKPGRALLPGDGGVVEDSEPDADIEVPEEVETALEELFHAVQDKVIPA
jgi:hypothetical protein